MSRLYEGMFLLDNAVVRESWDTAKSVVTAALEKHGAEVVTARRWDERRLAYPIKGRKRATYLLAYYQAGPDRNQALRRDLELDERVLRHLLLSVEAVPEGEAELAAAESSADFRVPAPPEDDAIVVEESPESSERDSKDAPKDAPKEAPKEEAKDASAAESKGDAGEAKAEPEKAPEGGASEGEKKESTEGGEAS